MRYFILGTGVAVFTLLSLGQHRVDDDFARLNRRIDRNNLALQLMIRKLDGISAILLEKNRGPVMPRYGNKEIEL